MIRRTMKWIPTVAVAGVALLGACDDDIVNPPTSDVDALFNKYVAIGNSITAGFQSGGISDSTQLLSYAQILAAQMGVSEFNAPLMNRPGCPPPLINVFTQDRGGYADDFCDNLRVAPIPEYLHNVAVPGAAVIDALTNLSPASGPNPLTTFFLGGRTQLEAAAEVEPTFVSVWIGNNDVLEAILDETNAGDPALITDPAEFEANYTAMMDSIDAFGSVEGGALIGVVQVGLAPYLSQGRAYFAAAAAVPALTVLPNCLTDFFVIPGTTDTLWVSVPFHYGAPIFGAAALGLPQTLDCSVPEVVSSAEMLNMVSSVEAYNATIAAEATARGWAYLDPNPILEDLLQDPTAIRPFPAFNPLDPQHETAPFGWALSRDGIHPSSLSHEGVAEGLIALINATYGTDIPEP